MSSVESLVAAMEGAFGPGWRVGPPLGLAEIERFEEAQAIDLPEDFRAFVAFAANGAIGPPAYGLVPLGAPAGANSQHVVAPGALGKPFPLTQAWMWEGSEDLRDEEVLTNRIEEVNASGVLPLGTDGCGMDYVLVVTGEARSQVWMLSDEFALPVATDFEAWIRGNLFPEAEWLRDFELSRDAYTSQ